MGKQRKKNFQMTNRQNGISGTKPYTALTKRSHSLIIIQIPSAL